MARLIHTHKERNTLIKLSKARLKHSQREEHADPMVSKAHAHTGIKLRDELTKEATFGGQRVKLLSVT